MTAKDYKLVVKILQVTRPRKDIAFNWESVVEVFTNELEAANQNFDRKRFVTAIYKGDKNDQV